MNDAYICDYIRTPIGKYAGKLAQCRPDDLAALTLRTLIERNPHLNASEIDEIVLGCANQAGEDNRNVARMSSLLAGVPQEVPGMTVNRLCASGMDAIATATRAIKTQETQLMIAGGVESMSRAPLVMPKPEQAFSRHAELYDTTIGWRFINPKLAAQFGADSMPQTAENLAQNFGISRTAQDNFAFDSQRKYCDALERGFYQHEIVPVEVSVGKHQVETVTLDEHPRLTLPEKLSQLRPVVCSDGTITAGNASGVNDGAAALLLASRSALDLHHLTPMARVVAYATSGVEPRVMGIGPAPAIQKVLSLSGLQLKDMDVIEINEAFSAQVLAVLKALNLNATDPRINPNGGAIALGHPLGMSGTRIVGTAARQLKESNGRYALCSMCVGVGQGVAMIIESVN
ncbi:3-oxoadipyl-CoA thiolase [Photobacterium sp. CCB-ST2H9]|uniref:3-oxoadipyl-CoA thiolase n=1 Tax=unclassified Photobacterium TaxID=2628852 RepID=UPI002003C367|nr:3-oxoadipyl-CoA thiolase [Photobacterium sp. CCB-ST2H9]UTM59995.1 3-oxoadipyl-CoA thiolase [Photobacterium sp. CCB-ST2H9]